MNRTFFYSLCGILVLTVAVFAFTNNVLGSQEEKKSEQETSAPKNETSEKPSETAKEPAKPSPPLPGPGKELHVLHLKNMIELQTYMKGITEALGVDCKYCHDLSAFWNDTENKKIAREMMVMMNDFNTRIGEFQKKFMKKEEAKISCFTCHHGQKEPVTSKAQWDTIQKKEAEKK